MKVTALIKRNLLIITCFLLLGGIYYTATQLNTEEIQTSDIQPSENLTLPEYLTLDWEFDRYNLSSHVFVGKVTMKESKRIGENNSGGIFTYITVQVERYDKGEGENEVTVRHIGGTVGNMSSSVIHSHQSPIFSVTVGQKYIFFNNNIEGEENLYTVKYIKMNMKP